jgi:hypothetical protein
MARKTVVQEFEERLESDLLDFAIEDLIKGARGSGVTLTEGECAVLLAKLPAVYSKNEPRWMLMAKHSFYREGKGDGVEAAVSATAKKYHVRSRQTVFDARRRWKEYFALRRSCGSVAIDP